MREADQWLSLVQAAEMLGVGPRTARQWADSGDLPHIRTPGGHRRFRRSDIEAFIVRLRAEAAVS